MAHKMYAGMKSAKAAPATIKPAMKKKKKK